MEKITKGLQEFKSLPTKNKYEIYHDLSKIISKDNAVKIYTLLLNITEMDLLIENEYYEKFKKAESKMLKKLQKLLNMDNLILMQCKRSNKSTNFLKNDFLYNFTKKSLLKIQNCELEHSINKYFGRDIVAIKRDNFFIIKNTLANNLQIDVKILSKLILKEDINSEFFGLFKDKGTELKNLIKEIYLNDKILYNHIISEIITENIYITPILLESLIELDFNRLPIYNYDVLSYFIKNKPIYKNDIIKKCMNIKKQLLLNLITENFNFFIGHFDTLNITNNDLLYISGQNNDILYYLMINKEFLKKFNMVPFCKLLSAADNEFILDFFKFHTSNCKDPQSREVIENLVINFLKYKQLDEKLKNVFTSVFLDSKKYFLTIMRLLDEEVIYKYLHIYIENDEDLIAFSKIISPTQLLYRAHLFGDINISLRITSMCYKRLDIFNESVFTQTIVLLESEIPVLTIKTIMVAVINFSSIKSFVVAFLIRNRNVIWRRKELIAGFFKCCQLLKEDAVYVYLELDDNKLSELRKYRENLAFMVEELRYRNNPKYRILYGRMRSLRLL